MLRDGAATLAQRYGKSAGVLVASGTAALEIGLRLVGVRPGDRVVIPAECCTAVPAAAVRAGARIAFGDVTDRLVLDPRRLGEVAILRPKAVIVVHYLGWPCDVRAVRNALGPEVAVIEDVAQAWGVVARGDPVGTWSDVVVTSFGPGKPMTLLEGGGVFADVNADELERAVDHRAESENESLRLACPLSP